MERKLWNVSRLARCAGWISFGPNCFTRRVLGPLAICPKCARVALELDRRDAERKRRPPAVPFGVAPVERRALRRRRFA